MARFGTSDDPFTVNGTVTASPPTGATATPTAAGTTDVQVTSAASRLVGVAVRETAGSAAVVTFYDGTSTAGTRLLSISLAANESVREWFGDRGIAVSASGIFVDRVSGTTEHTVYTGAA